MNVGSEEGRGCGGFGGGCWGSRGEGNAVVGEDEEGRREEKRGAHMFSYLSTYLLILHLNNLTTINKGVQQSKSAPLITELIPIYLPPHLPYIQPVGAGKSTSCGTNENMHIAMNLKARCLRLFADGIGRRRSGFGTIVDAEKGEDDKIHASGAKFKCHRLWEGPQAGGKSCQAAPGREWLEAKAMHEWK
ncbi:hypothetical protein QR685DRAFT_594159 [Neurospora intermedia]|uniref:Uncharacterized protein n=1 Tax=Neurospora intermedia TaxID=5142 RepID=A0ABR3DSJ6_NEUIN